MENALSHGYVVSKGVVDVLCEETGQEGSRAKICQRKENVVSRRLEKGVRFIEIFLIVLPKVTLYDEGNGVGRPTFSRDIRKIVLSIEIDGVRSSIGCLIGQV